MHDDLKNKGFTLIEVLAVIIMLAVIALIATPIILGIIEDSKKQTFVDTAYGLVDSAKYYLVKNPNTGAQEFVIENNAFVGSSLDIEGALPNNGNININENMQIKISISNDKWCAYKDYGESAVTVTDDLDLCVPDTTATCFDFDPASGSIYDYYDYDNYGTGEIECPREVKIPATIGGVAVTAIGDYAFSDYALTKVSIPGSVISIGQEAFYNNQLASVTIGENVETIGDSAFRSNLLTSLVIPSSVVSLGISVFNDNSLPANQAFIYERNGDGTIDNTSLVSYGGLIRDNVVIPSQVTNIGDNAFSNLGIAAVDLPDNILTIGIRAFSGNSLTTIVLSDSLTGVNNYAFSTNSINSVTYNSTNLINIGTCVFNNNPWAGANKVPFTCAV